MGISIKPTATPTSQQVFISNVKIEGKVERLKEVESTNHNNTMLFGKTNDYTEQYTKSTPKGGKKVYAQNLPACITQAFGKEVASALTEGQKITIAQGIFDNNRQTMTGLLNEVYKLEQIAPKISTNLISEEVESEDTYETISMVSAIISGDNPQMDEIESVLDSIGANLPNSIRETILKNAQSEIDSIQAGKTYEQYDINVAPEEINPDHLFAISIDDTSAIYVPDFSTLIAINRGTIEKLNGGFAMLPGENELLKMGSNVIPENVLNGVNNKEEEMLYVSDFIARKYLDEETYYKYTEDGTIPYDLRKSIAGLDILTEIYAQNDNNEVFDDVSPNKEEILNAIYQNIIENPEGIILSCPKAGTETMAIEGSETSKDELFSQRGGIGEVAFIHAKDNSIPIGDETTIYARDILENYSFNDSDGTLADLIYEDDGQGGYRLKQSRDDRALVLNALKQIAHLNPGMYEIIQKHENGEVDLFQDVDFAEVLREKGQNELRIESAKVYLEAGVVQDKETKDTAPPTQAPPTQAPPTQAPPCETPVPVVTLEPTQEPTEPPVATQAPPTQAPPTQAPPCETPVPVVTMEPTQRPTDPPVAKQTAAPTAVATAAATAAAAVAATAAPTQRPEASTSKPTTESEDNITKIEINGEEASF